MKFKAKNLDLRLELTTFSGEEVILEPLKKEWTSNDCIDLLHQWRTIENNNEEKGKEKSTGIEICAIELEMLYARKADWFLTNFDPTTISEIISAVASSIAGARKN